MIESSGKSRQDRWMSGVVEEGTPLETELDVDSVKRLFMRRGVAKEQLDVL